MRCSRSSRGETCCGRCGRRKPWPHACRRPARRPTRRSSSWTAVSRCRRHTESSGRGRECGLDEAEQLAAGARRPAVPSFSHGGRHEAREFRAVGDRIFGREFRERLLAAIHQPVTPAFRAPKARGILACSAIPSLERGADRFRVEAAHQLADELPLAQERGMARDPAREGNGIGEFLGQVNARGDARGRVNQAIGQVLHGQGLTLQFTFGWRRQATGQLTAAHGEMLARAPIQAARSPVQFAGPMAATQPDQKTLEAVVERAIALARAGGATAAEAGVSTGLSVTVRLGEVETLEYQRDRSLGVTVYAGQRKGSASTANLSDAAVEETIAKALSIASFTADDAYAGLPD